MKKMVGLMMAMAMAGTLLTGCGGGGTSQDVNTAAAQGET